MSYFDLRGREGTPSGRKNKKTQQQKGKAILRSVGIDLKVESNSAEYKMVINEVDLK